MEESNIYDTATSNFDQIETFLMDLSKVMEDWNQVPRTQFKHVLNMAHTDLAKCKEAIENKDNHSVYIHYSCLIIFYNTLKVAESHTWPERRNRNKKNGAEMK